MNEHVIGQEEACRALATRGYLHLKRAELLRQGNNVGRNECLLLLSDTSGCGKTLASHTFAKTVNIPFVSFDSTQASQTGIVGLDIVEDSVRALLRAAGDPKLPVTFAAARFGCILFDEFTKKATRAMDTTLARDIAGQSVQQEILMAMEGTTVTLAHRRPDREYADSEFSTNGTLFLFAGYIDDFSRTLKRLTRKKSFIGFGNVGVDKGSYIYDFCLEYGLIPEFVNRLTAIVPFRRLNKKDFIRIACSPHGPIANYNALLREHGLQVSFTQSAIEYMADLCIETGQARAIHTIVSSVVDESVFTGAKGNIEFGVEAVTQAEKRMSLESIYQATEDT